MLHKLNLEGWANTAWCVPSAISMITGISAAQAHSRAAFLKNIPVKKVKGVHVEEAILLLKDLGMNTKQIDLTSRYSDAPTIKEFLDGRTTFEKVMPVIFFTSDHAMAAKYNFAGDNWTKEPVPVADFPKLNRKVVDAYIVT